MCIVTAKGPAGEVVEVHCENCTHYSRQKNLCEKRNLEVYELMADLCWCEQWETKTEKYLIEFASK